MPNAYVVVLVVLLLGLAIAFLLPSSRSVLIGQYHRLRARMAPKPAPQDESQTALIDENGDVVPLDPPEDAPTAHTGETLRVRRQREWSIQDNRRTIVSVVVILIGLLALWQLPNLLPNRMNRFIVLVAPFNDADNQVSATGSAMADQLVKLLNDSRRGVQAVRAESRPTDLAQAMEMLENSGADVLVWGTVSSGAMLNQDSLIPALLYRPNGTYAPYAWDGYTGRFAMPQFFAIADAPINGEDVLARLLYALGDYGAGRSEQAFTALGDLVESNPALIATLPSALRGNLLWARGEYDRAAGEYRRAINDVARFDAQLGDPRAELNNNLGAILYDAHAPEASAVLLQTVGMLEARDSANRDLGALRYNLGLEYLRSGRVEEAVQSLEIARNLLPRQVDLELALSEAYRRMHNVDDALARARTALNSASQQVEYEAQLAPSNLNRLVEQRLQANVSQQQALVRLTELLNTHENLLWELQGSDVYDAAALEEIRDEFAKAVEQTSVLAQSWNRRSASEESANQTFDSLLALHQFQRASQLLSERSLGLSALEIELARMRGVEPPTGIGVIWNRMFGSRTALAQMQNELKRRVDLQPNDIDAAMLYGESLMLTAGPSAAAKIFDQAAAAAPERAEPVFGQALVAGAQGELPRAVELLRTSVSLNGDYFPARQRLAELAERLEDWPLAVEQRRWLADHRPSTAATLALAEALHNNGNSTYADAEQELLEVINDPSLTESQRVPALTALGRLYYTIGNIDSAHEILTRAQNAAPENPNVAYELGRVLVARGQSSAAAEQFRLAIEKDPQPVRAYLELANFYKEQANNALLEGTDTAASTSTATQQRQQRLQRYIENINAATNQYRAAYRVGASDATSLQQIGEHLMAVGDYEGAAQAYMRLTERNTEDRAGYERLAQAYIPLARYEQAQAAARRAIDLGNGYNPTAIVTLGDIARLRNQPEQATQQYNAALEQNPDQGSAYIGLGRLAADAGNWSVAAAHFQRGIVHESGSAEAHYWLAQALVEQGDINNAISEYRQALGLRPEYAEAYYGLAMAQLRSSQVEQREQARSNIELALLIRPDYAEAWLEKGKLEEAAGRDQAALDAYSQAISSNGRLAEPRYQRARLYIRQDQMSDAERDLEMAIRARPNFPEAHYWLGRVYQAQNRQQLAREEFGLAVAQRDGNFPDARFYQGIAEEQLGLRDAALESFRVALEQSDSSPWASDARAALARLGSQ